MKKKRVKYNRDENKKGTEQCKSHNKHHRNEKYAACFRGFFSLIMNARLGLLKVGLKGVEVVSKIVKQSSEHEAWDISHPLRYFKT